MSPPAKQPRVRTVCLALALSVAGLPLAAAPGDILWSFLLPGGAFSTPALDATGQIFIGTSGTAGANDGTNRLVALTLSPSTGLPAAKWGPLVARTFDWIDASPALSPDGGTAYVGSWDNRLYAFNTTTGALRWSVFTFSYITSSVAVAADGSLYFGSADGSLYALTSGGALRWTYPVGDAIESAPALTPEGDVVFATLGGEVVALRPNGSPKWSFQAPVLDGLDPRIKASPSIAPDGTVLIGSGNGTLYALEGATGRVLWTFEALGEIDSSVALAPDGSVYVVSRAGDLYALDRDGLLRWGLFLGEVFYSSPVLDTAGNLYLPVFAGNNTSTVHALSPDGVSLWTKTLPTIIDSSPVLTPAGLLLIGGYNQQLYALDTGLAKPETAAWPKFRRDFTNTGRTPPGVAPSLVSAPAAQVALVGETLTFTASATGTTPLSYLWRRQGTSLGVDEPQLTLTRLSPADAGAYELVVFNAFGSVTSAPVPLTVGGEVAVVGGVPRWTIHRPLAAAASVQTEYSPDLVAWQNANPLTTVASEAAGVQVLHLSAPLNLNEPAAGVSGGRVFFRLNQTTP